MDTIYTNPADPSNPHNGLIFAEQAAQDAFGKYYVRPRDRDFVDHKPWQKLGDVSDGVVEGLRRRRDHHLAGLDIDGDGEHDMAEV